MMMMMMMMVVVMMMMICQSVSQSVSQQQEHFPGHAHRDAMALDAQYERD